jgi:ribosome-binding factor A
MATSRRVARVAELIRREVSQMLVSEIKDDRVGAGMVSVTNINVSGDLQHAKIYVSIYGTDAAKAETMAGLKSATGFVRSELGQRIRLRRSPEIIFLEDSALVQGDRILTLLSQLEQERRTSPPKFDAAAPQPDEDWEDEDEFEEDEEDELEAEFEDPQFEDPQ